MKIFFLEDKLKKQKRKLENGNEIPKKKAKKEKTLEVNNDEDTNNTTEENKIEITGK